MFNSLLFFLWSHAIAYCFLLHFVNMPSPTPPSLSFLSLSPSLSFSLSLSLFYLSVCPCVFPLVGDIFSPQNGCFRNPAPSPFFSPSSRLPAVSSLWNCLRHFATRAPIIYSLFHTPTPPPTQTSSSCLHWRLCMLNTMQIAFSPQSTYVVVRGTEC